MLESDIKLYKQMSQLYTNELLACIKIIYTNSQWNMCKNLPAILVDCYWMVNLTKYSLEWENKRETLATRLFWHIKGICRGVSLFAWEGRKCKNRK